LTYFIIILCAQGFLYFRFLIEFLLELLNINYFYDIFSIFLVRRIEIFFI
jgi:hypothetical protein